MGGFLSQYSPYPGSAWAGVCVGVPLSRECSITLGPRVNYTLQSRRRGPSTHLPAAGPASRIRPHPCHPALPGRLPTPVRSVGLRKVLRALHLTPGARPSPSRPPADAGLPAQSLTPYSRSGRPVGLSPAPARLHVSGLFPQGRPTPGNPPGTGHQTCRGGAGWEPARVSPTPRARDLRAPLCNRAWRTGEPRSNAAPTLSQPRTAPPRLTPHPAGHGGREAPSRVTPALPPSALRAALSAGPPWFLVRHLMHYGVSAPLVSLRTLSGPDGEPPLLCLFQLRRGWREGGASG